MTYFSGADQTPSQEGQTVDFLAKLVQEKGEQWKDPATLAKGYIASQEFIQTLQREKEELLKDMQKQDYAKSVLEELKNIRQPAAGTLTGGSPKQETTTPPEDIRTLIKETITQQEKERSATQNLQAVDKQLLELFGADASNVVEKKRLELGLSKDRFKEIAAESPTAFLTLIGQPAQAQTNRVVQGSVNTAVSSLSANPSVRNSKYYTELRRTSPNTYHSSRVQNQMMKDRMELGDKFYQ